MDANVELALRHGLVGRLAKRLKVSPTAVSLVLHGKSKSARISAALDKALFHAGQIEARRRLKAEPQERRRLDAVG